MYNGNVRCDNFNIDSAGLNIKAFLDLLKVSLAAKWRVLLIVQHYNIKDPKPSSFIIYC